MKDIEPCPAAYVAIARRRGLSFAQPTAGKKQALLPTAPCMIGGSASSQGVSPASRPVWGPPATDKAWRFLWPVHAPAPAWALLQRNLVPLCAPLSHYAVVKQGKTTDENEFGPLTKKASTR